MYKEWQFYRFYIGSGLDEEYGIRLIYHGSTFGVTFIMTKSIVRGNSMNRLMFISIN
jgi:hypothetical protein